MCHCMDCMDHHFMFKITCFVGFAETETEMVDNNQPVLFIFPFFGATGPHNFIS